MAIAGDLVAVALQYRIDKAGNKLVVANEGESIDSTTSDAEERISIIDLSSFDEATTNTNSLTASTLEQRPMEWCNSGGAAPA